MKRLLIITQKVDETDDLLGFFVAWIGEFARSFEQVDVIALGVGAYTLPANVRVHSLGKERGVPKIRQWARFIRLLWRYTPSHGSVFAHMSPIFAIWAWPLARLRGCKLLLWYLHRADTFRLRLALLLSRSLVTADAASLTIKSQKIVSVGHGIDLARFAVSRQWPVTGRPVRIISVGRLSPIKDFATLIRAAAVLRERGVPVNVRIVGKAVMRGDVAYERSLEALVDDLGVRDIVSFAGFVPYRDIAAQYAWADVAVGCTPAGGIDKVLLEAMAAGCVVLTSNTVMRTYLEPYADRLVFRHGEPGELADKLQALVGDWADISARMVATVREHHDLTATIAKISALL